MKRLWSLLILLSIMPAGCGTVTFSGSTNLGNQVTTSGVVSIVRLTFASDGHGNTISVTLVTLTAAGAAQDLTFCGSQAGQFPMNSFVTAQFTPGAACSTLVSVRVN
jgi:hypothetical protein